MADVFNRITKQYLKSVNTPDYPESEWIINPAFIPSCESKYMLVKGDTIREMWQSEKDVVDYIKPAPEPTPEEIKKGTQASIDYQIEQLYPVNTRFDIIIEALHLAQPSNLKLQGLYKDIQNIKNGLYVVKPSKTFAISYEA